MTEFYFRNISFVELRYIKRTPVKGSYFLGGCFVKDNPQHLAGGYYLVLSSVLMVILVLWHGLFPLSRVALLLLWTTKTFCALL